MEIIDADDFVVIEGDVSPLIKIFNQFSHILSGEHLDVQAFESLCKRLKMHYKYPFLRHKDGHSLYDFFIPHIIKIASNQNATYEMFKLLEAFAGEVDYPLYGYALALSFEGSGLQNSLYTMDDRTSSEILLAKKKDFNYKTRFKSTHEAKDMLEAIIEHTDSSFASKYTPLLEKVKAALNVLDPSYQDIATITTGRKVDETSSLSDVP